MASAIARVAIAVVAAVLIVLAALSLFWAAWLLTTDDLQGGRHAVGLMLIPSAVVAGLVGLGLFVLAIRR